MISAHKLLNKIGIKIRGKPDQELEAIAKLKAKPINKTIVKEMNKMNYVHILNKTLPHDVMIEIVSDDNFADPIFIVKDEVGEINQELSYEFENITYLPLSDNNIKNQIIKFPSGVIHERNEPEYLIPDIVNFIRAYVELDDYKYEIIARYVLMTWVYERFDRIPYLKIIGPHGTGKSRLLDVLFEITYHSSKLGVGITPANIYRWLETYPGTLILDEADFPRSSNTDLITQILNGGYARSSRIMRCRQTNDGYDQESFNAFSPKLIACRELFDDDALESRMLTINSQVKTRTDIQRYLPERINWDEAISLRNRLLSYRLNNYFELDPNIEILGIESYEPRLAEILAPIIIPTNNNEIPNTLSNYIHQINEERIAINSLSIEAIVVQAIINLLSSQNTLTVGRITQEVNNNISHQSPLFPRRVGSIIQNLGFSSRRTSAGYVIEINENHLRFVSRRYGIELDSN